MVEASNNAEQEASNNAEQEARQKFEDDDETPEQEETRKKTDRERLDAL